jgi:predicted ATPase
LGPKRLELLHQLVPGAATVAVLVNPANPNTESLSKELQAAAQSTGLQLRILHAGAERDFDVVFQTIHQLRAGALFIGTDPFFMATQFLSLAEKAGTTGPLMVGHQMIGISVQQLGKIAEAQVHYDQGIALYDPVEHRPLATRFGHDSRVVMLSRRSAALWLLGYPDAALADTDRALTHARESDHAGSLLYALNHVLLARYESGNYAYATATADELLELVEKKGALFWKGYGLMHKGCACALNAQPAEAVRLLTDGFAIRQFAGATLWMPFAQSRLARAYIELGNFEDAWRSIREAMTMIERTKEAWCEAEVYRTAGEIMLLAPKRDAAKAEAYFENALAVARAQQAKSWELRAAMSMARLWRDQSKLQQARVAQWLTIILLLPVQFLVCLAKPMKLGTNSTNVHARHSRRHYAHLTHQYQQPS